MKKISFVLTGKTPLLMHADDVESADMLDQWRKDPDNAGLQKRGDDRTPPWTWQTYLYHDGEKLALPSSNVMVCIRQAAARVILSGTKTYKEVSQAGLAPLEEFCGFRAGSQEIMLQDILGMREDTFSQQAAAVSKLSPSFTLDVRRAKIGQAKHIRVRPRFKTWTVSGELEVLNPDVLTPAVLARIFDIAGNVGLGDWRPGCKTPGVFGKFEAKLK